MSPADPPGARAAVVVGYDGSPDAGAAVSWAARTARALGAPLWIVHAVGLLEHGGIGGRAPVEGAAALGLARQEGLEESALRWRQVDGDPCSALLRVVQDGPVAMIVVGSRGSGAHAGTLLGSTSLELAEHAPVPVTIVPPGFAS